MNPNINNEQYEIAIEVDGVQHAKFSLFFHDDINDFKKQKQNDLCKDNLCEKYGIKLLRINHTYTHRDKRKLYNHIYFLFEKCGFLNQLETDNQVLLIPSR